MTTVQQRRGPSPKVDDKLSETSSGTGSTPSLDAVSQGSKGKPDTNGVGGHREARDGLTRKLNLKLSFRTLSSQKKVEKVQDKNEPSRFLGEGVSFKAKLIGILEVNEARGDRMCQEALADLKMAIRAAGEHKQRITINIAIDGLRLRDEKNGDCLYHHPVHKISFIAQDMSDSRAFGYIFGSPDTGHRFFGIKTDKTASQVVIAMRDLFQVVFELKKKEIEMAKQHIEQNQIKGSGTSFIESASASKNGIGSSEPVATKTRITREETIKENGNASAPTKSTHKTSEVIADLLDLEFELNSIQQGIHQMERITPSDPFGPSSTKDPTNKDPFGDSFTPPATLPPPPKTVKQSVSTLPPPPAVKEPTPRVSDPFNVPPPSRQPQRRGGVRNRTAAAERFKAAVEEANAPVQAAQDSVQQEKHWFDKETESLFGEGELVGSQFVSNTATMATFSTLSEPVVNESRISPSLQMGQFDVFTDLDPLGTGRSKPYIDRKDFFQDLKNPPKKVLKDLCTEAPSEATAPLFQATFDGGSNRHVGTSDGFEPNTTIGSNSSLAGNEVASFPTSTTADPFEEDDPFYHTDPFENAKVAAFPQHTNSSDPFDTGFADFTMFGHGRKSHLESSLDKNSQDSAMKRVSPQPDASQSVFSPRTNFHGPLRVSLPPEKAGASPETSATLPSAGRQAAIRSSGNLSKPRTKSRLHKQNTMSGLPKLPSPKSSQRSNRLAKQMTVDGSTSRSHSLHPSPTPPTPPTPQRYDRRSPASHLESVTLRNRCAITPSPPVVACFPDMDDHSSRLSGSSAEFSEIAPEPPPRPASNVALIKPPPLPPKRQQAGNILRPPPRPPHTEDHPHYDYIENYETSTSPTPLESEELKSPPIPVPARRPRFSPEDAGNAPQRPRRHHPVAASASNKSSDEDYLTPIPFPLLPPPQKRGHDASRAALSQTSAVPTVPTTLAPLFPGSVPENKQEPTTATSSSLNLTLSQLTKTGFSDLATALGISPSQLSNMTLQELTMCLSKLSSDSNPVVEENVETVEEIGAEKGAVKREKYAALRESVDEEPMFKAEFENNFEDTFEKPAEEVFQETLFDKYAVFRELINEEKTEDEPEVKEDLSETIVTETEVLEESNLQENNTTITVNNSSAISQESADRYAALRDISIEDDAGAFSDKDESFAEVTRIDEDEDLLTLSRQHSESTESPTMETATMKGEQLSMIETTIYEEDVSTLDADDEAFEDVPDIMEDVEELDEEDEAEVKETPSAAESKESVDQEIAPAQSIIPSPAPEEMSKSRLSVDIEIKEEKNADAESWATFDTTAFPPEKPAELPSEEASPWSSDGKDFGKVQSPAWQEHFNEDPDRGGTRGRKERRSPWQEDELEEGVNERRPGDGPWRENGWSDGETYYEDGPPRNERVYHDDRTSRRRRVSPWRKGPRSSRDTSPWEHGRYQDRSMDEDEDDEEYEYWKTRPKHRGSSWDDERRRRFESREVNGLDYDEGRKRRPSPWGGEGDRRSSRESVNWEDDERYSQRDFADRRPPRDDEYRRRREPEMDPRGYAWSRKEGDYGRREPSRRPPTDGGRRYYRDRSRESPWEDEYSEHGDDDSPQYQNTKRGWPSKRPSSATEPRRPSDKSPGEFKVRDKLQYSLPMTRSADREGSEKGGVAERRYRDKCCARPQSREGHFNSDQEYEYWPERPRRESGGYEQRSQTLHTRRPNKFKKAQERSSSQKSPFDDDFSSHPLSISSSDIVKSQGGESDASDNIRKKSPINPAALFSYTDSFPRRRDPYAEEIRPNEMVPSSPLDPPDSPYEDTGRSRMSRSSYNRQSPFEDDFTPPDTRPTSGRRVSSVSSDVSDHRRSPYDDVRGGRRVPSVAEERECDNDAIDLKNGRNSDDVFFESGSDSTVEQRFADFDNSAFTNNSGLGDLAVVKSAAERRRTDRRSLGLGKGGDDGRKMEKLLPGKSRLSGLKPDPLNIKKSESVNIFTREKDPFDDDDFFNSQAPAGPANSRPRPEQLQHSSRNTEKAGANNSNDPFKWTKAFESFNFDEEK